MTGPMRVALTFDAEHPDRPADAGATEAVLDVLAERGVRGSFFVQGRWVEAYPSIARRIVDDGHLVGNHSFYHARMHLLSPDGSRRDGQHVSMMGADGPGKAEVSVGELARADLFCDDWEQASHGGELAAGVEAGVVARDRVTDIGRVLSGEADGRRFAEDITLFDSTGLAIQDLAIALAAVERAEDLDLQQIDL